MKAANCLVKILKAEGVPWASTFPSTAINNACGEEGLPLIMARDERYAVSVADGYSRCSDGKQFGVCTVMGGLNAAGIQYAYGAIAHAYEDSAPILVLTEGVDPSIAGQNYYDISKAFDSVTKWNGYINQGNRVPEFMRRAFTYLRTGRPGPVLIQLPRGVSDYDETQHSYVPVKGWKYAGDHRDVEVAVRGILSAKKPLIYAGQGIFYADACSELLEFAELVQAPVLTTLHAKSAFPEDHPLSVGVRGPAVDHFLIGSDLVFAIGNSLSTPRPQGAFRHAIPNPQSKIVIQSTVDALDINKCYTCNHAIIGDAKLVLRQMIEEAKKQTIGKPRDGSAVQAEIRQLKDKLLKEYTPALTSNDAPINPYRVIWDLMQTLDRKNSVLTHESGNTRDQSSAVYEAIAPHGYIGWSGTVSTLGFGLGAATGAKLAFPERQVVCLSGDAGVAYQMGNYEMLVRHKLGITIVHINNSAFAGYGQGFWGKGHSPYTWAVTPSTVMNMAKVAENMGMHAERVEKPDELVPAIKRALKANSAGKPAYIEVIASQYPVYPAWLSATR